MVKHLCLLRISLTAHVYVVAVVLFFSVLSEFKSDLSICGINSNIDSKPLYAYCQYLWLLCDPSVGMATEDHIDFCVRCLY